MKTYSLIIISLLQLFYGAQAFAILWKNMDINVEVFADKKAYVKEKHDLLFEEDDQSVTLPFFAGEKQIIVMKKIELLDIIKNSALPIPPLPPTPSASDRETATPTTPSMYYTYSAQNILSITLPGLPNKTYNLSIEYEIQEALRTNKQEMQLKYTWGHSKRNGNIKYFSFNLTIPSDWTVLEGAHHNISRENMAPKDQFVTDLHLRSLLPMSKGPKELTLLDEIFSCQLVSNLPEQIFHAYLPDLPPGKSTFPTTSPMSFRLKGTPDGTVNLQNVGVENASSFSLSDEQQTSLGPKNVAYFKNRLEMEMPRINSKLNGVVHSILFASINLYSKKEMEIGKVHNFTNTEPSAPSKNFDVTVLDESMTIIAHTLKISLRNPVIGEIEGIKMLTSAPAALLSDTDISSLAFTYSLVSCKKI